VLLQAVIDLEYVEEIYRWFATSAGSMPESDRIANAVQLITELIDDGWCETPECANLRGHPHVQLQLPACLVWIRRRTRKPAFELQ
jgi:hypothetical protein